MGKPYIVVGDKTSHGGVVIAGSPSASINGKPIARVGDKVTCPQHGHGGTTTIISGDPDATIDGMAPARHGDKTACGGTLIASQAQTMDDEAGGSASSAAVASAAAALATAVVATAKTETFDEQIRFVNANGAQLALLLYALKLDDGRIVKGTTDETGLTQRIVTDKPTRIVEATLTPKQLVDCCTSRLEGAAAAAKPLTTKVDGASTNATNIGSSVQKVQTPVDEARPLSAGEIAISRQLFADSIDYSKVKVHRGEYLWFGMQPDNVAMTPNGELYFNPQYFKEDFSTAVVDDRIWFIHEMTHVWQFQLGYHVKLRGALRLGLSYDYVLSEDKKLSDFNMEAQGDLLADYWAISFANAKAENLRTNRKEYFNELPLYRKILEKFLADPADNKNLP